MRKVVLLPLCLLAACNAQQSVADASAEVVHFHQELDRGDYKAIWDGAGAAMRAASPQDKFDKFLNAVHSKLGKVKESKQAGWQVNTTTGGKFVVLQQDTTFEKGTGAETFTFMRNGDQLSLVGYNINSQDMMIN